MSTAGRISNTWWVAGTEAKGESTWKKEPSLQEDSAELAEALEGARKLVGDNFDAEEPTIMSSAFGSAERFLRSHFYETRKRLSFSAPIPSITPGPKGSVDLHWEQPNWELLVNIPAGDSLATFYGEHKDGSRIKGTFNPTVWQLGIITWLSKI